MLVSWAAVSEPREPWGRGCCMTSPWRPTPLKVNAFFIFISSSNLKMHKLAMDCTLDVVLLNCPSNSE